MSTGTLVAASSIEVRIYNGSQLLGRETCESEEAVTAIVDRWSDVASLFVVADDPPRRLRPEPTPDPGPSTDAEETGTPLASRPLPCRGTE